MSSIECYLKGEVEKETEVNFYSKGMTKLLNCNSIEEEYVCEE